MKKTLSEQVQAFMGAHNPPWKARQMADAVRSAQAKLGQEKTCSRQNIEHLLKSVDVRQPRYMAALALAMGTTVEALTTGKGGLSTENVPFPIDISERKEVRLLPPDGEGQLSIDPELSGSNQSIPTDMPFSNRNLAQTFTLLGNIIAALPNKKRAVLTDYLKDLVEEPEHAKSIAKYAIRTLGVPDAVTGNAELNRWLAGDLGISVETRPAPLDHK